MGEICHDNVQPSGIAVMPQADAAAFVSTMRTSALAPIAEQPT
jgi:hypothetical protein